MLRAATHLVVVLALFSGTLLVSAGPAGADHGCIRDPWPSFTTVAPSARTVVVGTVSENLWRPGKQDRTYWFRLDVDEVLRGSAPASIEIQSLTSGLPRSASSDPHCDENPSYWARVGDRIAIAYDGKVPGVSTRVTTVAWISGRRVSNPGAERLPLRQVRRLAGQARDGSRSEPPYAVGPYAAGLVTREIAPGVGRIVPAFTPHELSEVRYLAISPDGTLWAGTQTAVVALDRRRPPSRPAALPRRVTGLTSGLKGSVLVEGWGPVASSNGVRWTRLDQGRGKRTDFDQPLTTTDGTIWAVPDRGVARLDDDGWTRFGWGAIDPPCTCLDRSVGDGSCACWVSGLVEAPDGSVWAGFQGSRIAEVPFGGGIRSFDGSSWLPVIGPLGEWRFSVTDLVPASDGSVWASILLADAIDPETGDLRQAHLARWNGEVWTSFEWPSWMRRGQRNPVRQMEAGPDGSIWFEWPFMSFDGATWTRYEIPSRAGSGKPRISDLAVAPDGSSWIVVRDVIKYGTSRPDGLYVLDPQSAAAAEQEPAMLRPGREADSTAVPE